MSSLFNKDINYNQDLVEQTKKAYEATSNEYIEKHGYTNEMESQIEYFINLIDNYCIGKKILDVGCGPGRDAKVFFRKGFKIYGIDIVPEFIKKCKERTPGGHFYVEDMRNLKFLDNSFDGIWNCAALMHLSDPKQAVKEIHRVLKEDGILYISVLNKEEDSILTGEKYGEGAKFFKGYTEKSLSSLIKDSGFKILNMKANSDNWQNLDFLDVYARKR